MSKNRSKEHVLKELFNVSIGKSARIFSEIIDKQVSLKVPDVKILHLKNDVKELDIHLNGASDGAIMISSISFKDKLEGKASLVFPADKMRNFINMCLNNSKVEYGDLNFTDIDFDIIKEVGNLVLNPIIGEVGNYIETKFNYTLPEIKVFNKMDMEKVVDKEDYKYILILSIAFNIEHSEIEGAIIINLTLKTLDQILSKINMMEDGLDGKSIT